MKKIKQNTNEPTNEINLIHSMEFSSIFVTNRTDSLFCAIIEQIIAKTETKLTINQKNVS